MIINTQFQRFESYNKNHSFKDLKITTKINATRFIAAAAAAEVAGLS